MKNKAAQNLPDYENPPIKEVLCGILFKPIEEMLAPHFGLLWEKFKPEFPNCQEVAPLFPQIEFQKVSPKPDFELLNKPPLPRIWFIESTENGIIQVQRDRFLYNWRKLHPKDEYPHYHSILRKFQKYLSVFKAFLDKNKLGTLEPLQYEMTYLNHILQGNGWETDKDIGKIFTDFSWQADKQRFLPIPEDINWRASFLLPDGLGRLRLRIQKAQRHEDKHPLILFELIVRGIGKDKSPEAMLAWFDLAHEWIVSGFADLTGPEIQKSIWRRKQ